MYTYAILDLLVLGCIALIICLAPIAVHSPRQIVYLCVTLLVLTTIFDSVIIGLHIVAYDPARILGVHIGGAPIEDFAYTVAVCVVVPYLWRRGGDE